MIRVIAWASMLGALVASVAVYTKNPPEWRNAIKPLFVELDPGAETAITPESWPICTTMASVESDADWAQLDPDFKTGKKALAAGDLNGAIAAFEFAALRDPLRYPELHRVCLSAATSVGPGYWPLSAGADVESPPP